MSSSSFIEIEKIDFENYSISKISLNDPDKLNPLSMTIIDEFIMALEKAELDESVRCIIITGKGKAFSVGGDIKKMKNKEDMFEGSSYELRNNYIKGIQKIPRLIENMRTPIIAQINGIAAGAGCDLACMCDLRVGSEHAKFGEVFANMALVPGDGGTYFLPRVVGFSKAMEMTLTCKVYNADESLQIGLLNFKYPASELDKKTTKLAQTISEKAPGAIQMAKNALKHSWHSSLNSQLDLLAAYQGIAQRMNDHDLAVDAFLEKKIPEFLGN